LEQAATNIIKITEVSLSESLKLGRIIKVCQKC
jgi:hypothetical protein